MLFREHRETLAESMETCVEMLNSKDTLTEYILNVLEDYGYTKQDILSDISVPYYAYDKRNGWDTYIVLLKGYGVFGFTNEPVDLEDLSEYVA